MLSKSHRARTITSRYRATEDDDRGDEADSVVGDEVFDFDDVIVNSTAYRRAFYSFNIKARNANDGKRDPKPESSDNAQSDSGYSSNAVPVPSGSVGERNHIDLSNILTVRDEDYFDVACQRLFHDVQRWVIRFSKFSDSKSCRSSYEIDDEKTVDRFDNAILDGTDLDRYISHRVRRRNVFTSVVMTMIWEYVFTRYMFGLNRESRQQLKALEKDFGESKSGESFD